RHVAGARAARGGADHVADPSAALRPNQWEHRARHPDVAEELQAPVAGPLRVRDREEVAAADRSRVVDEDVDPAEALMDLAGDPLHFVEPAEVAGHDERLGARLPRDLPRRRLQRPLIARAQRDAGALGGERTGDRAAEAPARSGHERDFFLELAGP